MTSQCSGSFPIMRHRLYADITQGPSLIKFADSKGAAGYPGSAFRIYSRYQYGTEIAKKYDLFLPSFL